MDWLVVRSRSRVGIRNTIQTAKKLSSEIDLKLYSSTRSDRLRTSFIALLIFIIYGVYCPNQGYSALRILPFFDFKEAILGP